MYYSDGAGYGRYYEPLLGRFSQPDTLVPNPGDPQQFNRFTYARNNPLRYRDSTGHWLETAWDIANILWDIHEVRRDPSLLNIGALVVDAGATLLPFVPAGVGMVARGGKAAKAVTEVATHADEVADAAKVAKGAAEIATHGSDALKAASRLAEVGLHSDEAADLVRTISRASTEGPLRESGVTVLGHFPDYVETANRMSANYFDMAPEVWEALDDAQRWAVNRQFIDDAIARGDTFYLSTELLKPDSYFAKELARLHSLGYEISGQFLVKVR